MNYGSNDRGKRRQKGLAPLKKDRMMQVRGGTYELS